MTKAKKAKVVSEPSKPAALKQLEKIEASKPAVLKQLEKLEASKPAVLRQLERLEASKPAVLKQLEKLEASKPAVLRQLEKIEASKPAVLKQLEKLEAAHGGARPGAGRPRTRSLDVDELELLLKLLTESPYAAEYADTAAKLEQMVQAGGARAI